MSVAEGPESILAPEKAANDEKAIKLNGFLKEGASIWDVEPLTLARSLRKPIFVPFTHVLMTAQPPWMRNPEAEETLRELDNIGTVVVLADKGQDFTSCESLLQAHSLWKPQMVILGGVQPLSTIFQKPYEIPMIWGDPDEEPDQPGTVSFQIRDFALDDLAKEGFSMTRKQYQDYNRRYDKSRLSLKDAIRLVRAHYSTPFARTLGNSSYPGMRQLADTPNTVIRVDNGPSNVTRHFLRQFKKAADILQNKYHISIPKHQIVLGPPERPNQNAELYQVVGEVKKASIEENLEDATSKLDEFYAAAAQYYFDQSKGGGPYFIDLVNGPPDNEQIVYGRQEGDKENHVYFVDLDPYFKKIKPGKYLDFVHDTDITIFGRIIEFESKYKVKLSKARQKLLELLGSIGQEEKNYPDAQILIQELNPQPVPA